MTIYYSVIGADGMVKLSRASTDANFPFATGERCLPDTPINSTDTHQVYRVEPVAAGAAQVEYGFKLKPPQLIHMVSMRQARLALLANGSLATVVSAIAALPSPQKEQAQIEWEYSQEVQRNAGLVSMIAPILGLDEAGVDALFIQASKL